MSYINGPKIVNNGMVLHLDAANSKSYPGSGTSWNDLSGNANNGTLINGPTFTSNNNGRINIDGINDRIDIPYASTNFINTSFTWIIWILGTINNNGPMPVIGYGSGAWPRLGFRYSNNWSFAQYGNSGTGNIDVNLGDWSSTNWLFLAVSADFTNSNIKGYRNGVLNSSVNNWRDSTGNGGNLGLGRAGNTSWPNAVLSGAISSFSIYDRALSASEILQNYNATKSRYSL
jgi:hypothetical protein